MRQGKTTALLIPCPDYICGKTNWKFKFWYKIYKATRIIRHFLNLHDWEEVWIDVKFKKCSWCWKRETI